MKFPPRLVGLAQPKSRKVALRWAMLTAICASAQVIHPLQAQKNAAENPIREGTNLGLRVEMMEVLPAAKIARGLGFNLKFSNSWEFARAKMAGATQVRFQFDWPSVERSRGELKLTPQMSRALDLCAENNLEPLIVAAYAPLAKPIGDLVLRADAPAGATSLSVSGAALSLIHPPSAHILRADGMQIVAEGRWAYYGALIDATSSMEPNRNDGTLTLAAKTNTFLPAGTVLRVNELLYPSAATQNAEDSSLAAYGRYARFLAQQIAAHNLRGQVELWNEPPWIHDRWDARGGFYDVPPANISALSPNPGMLDQFLNGEAPPRGVSFVWGGANKSGGRGLGARRATLSASQLANVSADSIHPYGDSPETHAWNPEALRAGIKSSEAALIGTNTGSNFKVLRQNQMMAQRRGVPFPSIIASEIGHRGADENQKTRYDLRAFLMYLALGLERVNFYKLADKPGQYGFLDDQTQEAQPVYRSFQSLMATINSLPKSTANTSPIIEAAPTIAAYGGAFPLTTIPISSPNRWLMVTYQRTFASPPQKWDAVPSPPPAAVQMRVPPGYRVLKVWNLVSGAALDFQASRETVTYLVSDDPIMVEMSSAP